MANQLNYVKSSGKIKYGPDSGGTYTNLLCSHPPFQIDGNLGYVAGVCEMLLQSHFNELHILPALQDAWADGHVTGIRARGGFEVDIKWEKHQLVHLKVKSLNGNRLKIRYKSSTAEMDTEVGQAYTLPMFNLSEN